MKAIYRYELNDSHPGNVNMLYMPTSAQVLSVALYQGMPCLWVMVKESTTLREMRRFQIFGMGQPIPNSVSQRHYVGTVVNGAQAWHVFDERKDERL
jgi:hypothetical protein